MFKSLREICTLAAIAIVLFTSSVMQAELKVKQQSVQEMLSLPVHVVNGEGEPVAGAVVIPWALRCSQGHGPWRVDGLGDSEPPELMTDANGMVEVPYPRYAVEHEFVRTTQVTLSIDHPEFAVIGYEFIDVPLAEQASHTITLDRGASVQLVPFENGKPAELEGLRAMWSDDRSWKPEISPTITEDGALQLPRMRTGEGQVLLVRLDDKRATHFTSILDLELTDGDAVRQEIELRPSVKIEGMLSDNVPRPVQSGRLKVWTLSKEQGRDKVNWFTWAPIAEDGSFLIDGWPAGEAVQIVALCDGFIAESGKAPDVIENPRDPDPYYRPQVFLPQELGETIVLQMAPMARCEIETLSDIGDPLPGVKVQSYPNVGWWNGGSQTYCSPLVRCERLLVTRDYRESVDKAFPQPFSVTTDANGRGELEMPVGNENFRAEHSDYELPVVLGKRSRSVDIQAGETTSVFLILQPKGAEHLGEWDKLSGILFGCTGEQCRRLLEDEDFREKMTKIRVQFDAAEDPTKPKVLSKAYTAIADAFEELGDQREVATWRRKAADEAAKLAKKEQDQAVTGE